MIRAYDDQGQLITEDTSLTSDEEQRAALIVANERSGQRYKVVKYRYGSREIKPADALAHLRARR